MPPNSLISIAVNSFDYLQTNLVHASVKRVYRVLFVVAHLRFTFPHPRAPDRMNDMKFAGPDYQLSPTKNTKHSGKKCEICHDCRYNDDLCQPL